VRFRWRSAPGPAAERDRVIEVGYLPLGGDRYACRVDGEPHTVAVVTADRNEIVLEDEAGVRRRFAMAESGATRHVCAGGRDFVLVEEPRLPDGKAARAEGGLSAPMTGRVVRVLVAEGDECATGQALVILEAMKMEHAVKTAHAGRVSKLLVREGDPVEAGAVLVALDPLDDSPVSSGGPLGGPARKPDAPPLGGTGGGEAA
jgi:biotin carboxyl carrier protein